MGAIGKRKFDDQVDSSFRVSRTTAIREVVLAAEDVEHMSHYLESTSGDNRRLHIYVLPQEKEGPNVRVGVQMPDSSIKVVYYYRVDPYSLDISRLMH